MIKIDGQESLIHAPQCFQFPEDSSSVVVYSVQLLDVIKKLENPSTYRASWSASAASDPARRDVFELAYLWLKDQYENRLKRPLQDGFFWVAFDKNSLKNLCANHKKNGKNFRIVTLNVPRNELLILRSDLWNKILDFNKYLGKDKQGNEVCSLEGLLRPEYYMHYIGNEWIKVKNGTPQEDNIRSFEQIIFNTDNCSANNLEGVLDRVEREWIKEIKQWEF